MTDVVIKYKGPRKLKRAHPYDACYDVYPDIAHPIILLPKQVYKIRTGLHFDIPPGWALLLEERSGFPYKGLTIHLLGGVIDSGFRGEVIGMVTNSGELTFSIDNNHAIAQLRVVRVYDSTFVKLSDEAFSHLPGTSREDKGFGSTNK